MSDEDGAGDASNPLHLESEASESLDSQDTGDEDSEAEDDDDIPRTPRPAPPGEHLESHLVDAHAEVARLKRVRRDDDDDDEEEDQLPDGDAAGSEDEDRGSEDTESRSSVEDAWARPPKRFRLEGAEVPSDDDEDGVQGSDSEADFGSDDGLPKQISKGPHGPAGGPAFMGPAAARPLNATDAIDGTLDDELASDDDDV